MGIRPIDEILVRGQDSNYSNIRGIVEAYRMRFFGMLHTSPYYGGRRPTLRQNQRGFFFKYF